MAALLNIYLLLKRKKIGLAYSANDTNMPKPLKKKQKQRVLTFWKKGDSLSSKTRLDDYMKYIQDIQCIIHSNKNVLCMDRY